MSTRTDTEPSSDTLGIPETRDELVLGCAVCHGKCAVKETILFFRIGERFEVAHLDCALPARPVRS